MCFIVFLGAPIRSMMLSGASSCYLVLFFIHLHLLFKIEINIFIMNKAIIVDVIRLN